MNEEVTRPAYCRQKLEDVKAHLHDILVVLTPDKDRLKVFDSMLMGRIEAINDAVVGSIDRLKQYEEFQRKANPSVPSAPTGQTKK